MADRELEVAARHLITELLHFFLELSVLLLIEAALLRVHLRVSLLIIIVEVCHIFY